MRKEKQSAKQIAYEKPLSLIVTSWEENMMWDDHGFVAIGERKKPPFELKQIRKEK